MSKAKAAQDQGGATGPVARVLLATEGTYPFHRGGVSTWCDVLAQRMPDVRFTVFAVVMNPFVTPTYTLPPSVERMISVPLWGTQDPSEHRLDLPFSEIFAKKHRTTADVVSRVFLPLFTDLVEQLQLTEPDPARFGETVLALYRYLLVYDYEVSFKSAVPWQVFRERTLAAAAAGRWPAPTVFDLVQGLGWVYRFLTILNTPVPPVDLAHSSAAAFCGLSAIIAKLHHGAPYLLTEHGVYLREQYLAVGRSDMGPFARAFLLSLVRTVVAANLHHADEVAPVCRFNGRWERRLGARPESIRPIYNGVSPEIFAAAPESGPDGSAPARGGLRILNVARMDPNKDIETFLRAAALVRAQLPDAVFRVQGAISVPAYDTEMRALTKELGLTGAVTFEEHTSDIAAVYRDSDIVVQSSVTEAFPYAVIEAMMTGRPVVATEVGGTAEALADTGLLVTARHPEQLAQEILRLAGDPALRARLGAAARARALELFSIERTIDQFQLTYRRLIGERREGAHPRRQARGAVARALALLRQGRPAEALAEVDAALADLPASAAAPALLALRARVWATLGHPGHQAFDLVRARLLHRRRDAG